LHRISVLSPWVLADIALCCAALALAIVSGIVLRRAGHTGADAHWRALLVALVGYAFLLRVIFCAQIELLPEEAYYWNYSRHLDIGYLDHPPMVAWLIKVGTAAFGQSQVGVRAGALCCGVITAVFTYRLTRNLFDEATALAAVMLAQVLP